VSTISINCNVQCATHTTVDNMHGNELQTQQATAAGHTSSARNPRR